jgi:tRNA threonylcarbamoyladenosine biosynthesis protein TsaB
MATLLLIESSSSNCSVALSVDGKIIASKSASAAKYIHAESLHPFIEEVMLKSQITMADLNAVAISSGPGSYTGLRIGTTAAKGICFSLSIPLIAISTIDILAYHAQHTMRIQMPVIPMIDARRMEVYCSDYDENGKRQSPIQAAIIDHNFFITRPTTATTLIGDGAAKCQGHCPETYQIISILPDATMMASLAQQAYLSSSFEDLAYFEPFYLKEYVPGIATKSIL